MKKYTWAIAGLLFAVLWSSASTATKIGLASGQPLVIAVVRFGIASAIMLLVSYSVTSIALRREHRKRRELLRIPNAIIDDSLSSRHPPRETSFSHRLPVGKEWMQLAIYGSLNVTIYLGLYVIAMQTVTAGIGALAIATNPVFISFLSVFFLKRKLSISVIAALIICTAGVVCAAWPLLGEATVTTMGLILLGLSMLAYSVAAIYFSTIKWTDLNLFTINGWQTLIGGVLLLPFALFYYDGTLNAFDTRFWIAVLWLAIPVSIFAVLLWLWLLKTDALKAGMWLFLCPISGFIIAAWIMKDSISVYTLAGVVLVVLGLFISQTKNSKEAT